MKPVRHALRGLPTASVGMLAAAAACGGSEPTSPGPTPGGTTTAVVSTPGNTFSPPFLTIALGASVRFEIRGNPHNVIFSTAGAPANINVVSNTDVTRTFATRGTFPYDCTVHPGMSGEIIVR
ncbi:MAG TPA: plastocyanin/azurin family copper-binding protein [Gemmatimonadaceae bacterium]|nr:plastocyanin/azurin family copper-binding protein [Gemmatimonadaceae bacterium]